MAACELTRGAVLQAFWLGARQEAAPPSCAVVWFDALPWTATDGKPRYKPPRESRERAALVRASLPGHDFMRVRIAQQHRTEGTLTPQPHNIAALQAKRL